jgi:Ca2+-binding RTX toxin-like protein
MFNLSGTPFTPIANLDQVFLTIQELLQNFFQDPEFSIQTLAPAFGTAIDLQVLEQVQVQFSQGDFSALPDVEIRSGAELVGTQGAYAPALDRIYLSHDFLNTATQAQIVTVVLEEIGHALDARLNQTDSPGDEGALFAAIVQNETLSPDELVAIQNEDDTATIVLDGQVLQVERSSGFDIVFDYRFDTNNFFTTAVRNTLEAAAAVWESHILDEFDNVAVGNQVSITNPQTGAAEVVTLTTEIDDLLLFVGAQSPPFGDPGEALARGGFTSGTAGTIFSNRLTGSDVEPWVGNLSFEPTVDWFFDQTIETDDDIPSSSFDFFTVALHEIGHALGVAGSSISDQVATGGLSGANSLNVNGGVPIPVEADLAHIQDGFAGDTTILDPTITNGTRNRPTIYDLAWLADIGYEIADFQGTSFTAQGSVPPIATESADVTIFGTIVADTIDGLGGNDQIQGDAGNDTLNGGTGNDTLIGQAGDDILNGDGDADQLQGGIGNDTLNGGTGNDTLFGQDNDDTLNGDAGVDQLQGGDGNDTLNGGADGDNLFGQNNDDVLNGDGGNDFLNGGAGNDTLNGGADNDTLNGGADNDTLNGGIGNDTLQGDVGIDTFFFEANNGEDTINDFDIANEVILIAADLGFATPAEVFATLSRPFSNVSRFTLSPGNIINVFHDSLPDTPLTEANFQIEAVPTVTIAANDADGAEEATDPGQFTLTLSEAASSNITITYTIGGTATNGTDYGTLSGSATITAGTTTTTIDVTPVDDSDVESSETVILTLQDGADYDLGATTQATVTLADNDGSPNQAPTALALSNNSVLENVAMGTTIGTFSTTDPDGADTFTYTLVSGSGDTDNGTFTIAGDQLQINASPNFESQSSYNIRVRTTDQGGLFHEETLTISVTDQAIVTINDPSTTETDASQTLSFTVNITDPLGTAFTVDYTTEDRTAFDNGFDYTAVSDTLAIAADATSATIDVTVLGDTIPEASENFALLLSNPSNSNVTITDGEGLATITDNDPIVTLSIQDGSVVEGDSGSTVVAFVVSLSAPSGQAVTVDYATADNTATTANNDYTSTSGTLTFAPGNTSTTITVPVIGDTGDSTDETFFLNLSNASGATISDTQGVGTILDDESGGTITINGTSGFDVLLGSGSDESLVGLEDNDYLLGLGGNDIFTGGPGSDYLSGFTGLDTFVYGSFSDSLVGGPDTIARFSTADGDKLNIGSLPLSLFSVGTISAGSLNDAAIAAYAAADSNTGLVASEAVLFGFGSTNYISVNDATAAFDANNDLVVKLLLPSGLPGTGTLTVGDYFTT